MKHPLHFIIFAAVSVFVFNCSAVRFAEETGYENDSSKKEHRESPETPLELHAALKDGTDALLEAYNLQDYAQAKYELESLLTMMDQLPLETKADKIDYLDRHYAPKNQDITFAIIADDLTWRKVKAAPQREKASVFFPAPGESWEKAEVPDELFEPEPPVTNNDRGVKNKSRASVEKPKFKHGSYFSKGLHRFIQKEIHEVAIRMGEPQNFKLPKDFVKEIEYYIRRFQNEPKYHEFFERSLRRSRKYVPALRKYFTEKGFPEEIIYFAMIESGFNPVAYSRSHAAGMFQFIKSTGKSYGLKITRYNDERYSPVKAAIACREYLHDLQMELGSFTLALSSYNSGAGKTRTALRQLNDFRDRSFWAVREKTKVLKHETREYIPQIFAAIVMAKPGNPEKFGFQDVPLPRGYRTVVVPHPVKLQPLANAAKIRVSDLLRLNPDLAPGATSTPSRVLDYPLFVPKGKEKRIAAAVKKFTKNKQQRIVRVKNSSGRSGGATANRSKKYHKVRRGESLWLIARKYGVSVNKLKKWNGLRSSQIYPGRKLVVYTPGKSKKKVYRASAPSPGSGGNGGVVAEQTIIRGESFRYAVAPGNSLGKIAALFGVSTANLRQWNGLSGNAINVGQKLKIISRKNIKYYKYRVRSGDTLGSIAQRFSARISTIKFANGKSSNLLRVGEVLKVFSF